MIVQDGGIVSNWSISLNERGKGVMSGAAYSPDGKLIESSLRRVPRGAPVQNMVKSRILPKNLDGLSGSWLYCGNWNRHFGHFIMEPLTRLYVEREGVDGLIFHPNRAGDQHKRINEWQRYLIDRAGFDLPVLITENAIQVERLVVAEPQVVIERSVSSHAMRVWKRVAKRVDPTRKVFLSRSKLRSVRNRELVNDSMLDDLFMRLGFEVVHPQLHSVADQLDVVASARVLAGVSGSALHQSVFGPQSQTVIEIGDLRSKNSALPMQRIIDKSAGRVSEFIPYLGNAESKNRDLDATRHEVEKVLDCIPEPLSGH